MLKLVSLACGCPVLYSSVVSPPIKCKQAVFL